MKQNKRKNNKTFLISGLLFGIALILVFGFFLATPFKASAAIVRTPVYTTYGSYSYDGKTYSGYPSSSFKVTLNGALTEGTGTIYNNNVINWTWYTFKVVDTEVYEHVSVKLYKNNSLFYSQNLSDDGNITLFDKSLSDGEYRLEYSCKVGNWFSNTLYTYTYCFRVDSTAPTVSLKAGGSTISDGTYTNKQVVYSATDASTVRIYVKSPSASDFGVSYNSSYTVAASAGNNGWWYVYASDSVDNSTSCKSFYMDVTLPYGTVYGGTSSVSSGGYTNASYVKYVASDSNSGVANCYVRKPGSSSYVAYTSGSQLTTEGTYYFYCVDKAGNTSSTSSITLDRSAPSGTLYGGLTSKSSGSYTNADYVKYTATDSGSGVNTVYVKMPNTSLYTTYSSGTQLATEGTYSFYCVDKAGNQSSIVTITLDKTKPTGRITGDANNISQYTKASYIKFIASDSNSGVANCYVKKPNSSSYVAYTSGTELTVEGSYTFYCTDKAGNTSEYYTVTVDRQAPSGQLYVDGKAVSSGAYTNGKYIKFVCSDNCYVKMPDSTSYTKYVSGTEFEKVGKYVFYSTDAAGNSSSNYTIIIDRTQKKVTLTNITDNVTNGDVKISWSNGDSTLYAPIKSVTVNGKSVTNGQTIYTIRTGVYTVSVLDTAGNVLTTSFSSEKQNILTAMLQKEYFETTDKDGNIFAFASYEKALEFAISRENGFVKIGTWNSSSWNTGIAMDEKDSVNAKNGQYFIYKKSGNPSEQVAYFTVERLNEVISEYAIASIKNYYYWEKAPEVIADGETLYSYADDNGIVENKIEICENVSVLLDGVEVDTTVIETEGKHVITILDEYGNSCEYPVTIIRTAPTVNYVVGEEITELSFERIYYFKNEVTISISDELDDFAMFRVYRIDLGDDRQLIGIKSLGESFTLSESGTYAIVAINHAGESEYYNVLISLNAPEIVFDANAENKQLIITVKPSIDFESHIQSLVIYKSTDGGENWEIVSADDYGTPVELETLVYKFNTSAMYRVALSDEFHTGIDVISKEIKYTQPTLAIELEGVENGGYTSGVVKFSWKDEAKVTATKNGVAFDYRTGVRLSEDGDYVITFENNDGYKVVYEFTIDTKKPTMTVNGAKNDEIVNNDVSISFNESGLKGILFKDGESISEYISETVISEDGYYTLIVTDKANNQSEVSFSIDKTVNYIANIKDGALANSVIIVENEKLEFVVTRNGEVIEYDDGDEITEPADYVVKMTDKLGNSTELSFTIVEPIVNEFKYNFDNINGFEKVLVNGEETRLNYGTLELFDDGEYEVEIVANGESNIFYVTVDATAPTLTMKGVTNNGKTNGVVVLSDVTEDAEVKVFLNDDEIEYTVGEELSEIGKYKVVVTDECGNTTEYDFSIEKGANIGLFVLIGIVVLAAAGVIVFFVIKKKNSI